MSRTFSLSQTGPLSPLNTHSLPSPGPCEPPSAVPVVLTLQGPRMSDVTQRSSFCAWLMSLSIKSSRLTHVAARVRIPFSLRLSHCIACTHISCSSIMLVDTACPSVWGKCCSDHWCTDVSSSPCCQSFRLHPGSGEAVELFAAPPCCFPQWLHHLRFLPTVHEGPISARHCSFWGAFFVRAILMSVWV